MDTGSKVEYFTVIKPGGQILVGVQDADDFGKLVCSRRADRGKPLSPPEPGSGSPTNAEGDHAAERWDDLDEFCTVDDITDLIPVNRKTLYDMIRRDEVPGAQHFGRKILLHTQTVRDWLTGHST